MTTKLYYQDSKICQFSATCLETLKNEAGYQIRLDQTAFYPTSGGQPHDSGTINGIPVLDVWLEEDGTIWHQVTDAPNSSQISGEIEWHRRFDHMQQHTGQHILSAVFVDQLNANTIGFHIGSKTSTLDLNISKYSREQFRQIERTSNQIIWENQPISIQTIRDQDIPTIPFRKPPKVSGKIRVIWIDDYDVSACGGTHVAATGEIGVLKITGVERYKGGLRVNFLCGGRALENYQEVLANIQQVSADLSIHTDDLPQTIRRFQTESSNLNRQLRRVQNELMNFEIEALWQNALDSEGIRKVTAYWDNRSFEAVRSAAARLREKPKTVVLFAAEVNDQIRLVCARSSDLTEINAGAILKSVVTQIGGKGGGSPEMAQGGAPKQENLDIQALLKSMVLIKEGK